jgi:hypothetical protein
MNRRAVFTLSFAVVLAGMSGMAHAAPPDLGVPVRAMSDKAKMVKLNIRNDSGQQMTLRAGADVVTIEAGKTTALRLPVGTRIVMENSTPTHEAGTLLAQVAKELGGATLAVK